MNFVVVQCFANSGTSIKYEVIINLNNVVAVEQTSCGGARIHLTNNVAPFYTTDKYEVVREMIERSVKTARADYYGLPGQV